eukprot:1492308-Rhodomonas_salina.2
MSLSGAERTAPIAMCHVLNLRVAGQQNSTGSEGSSTTKEYRERGSQYNEDSTRKGGSSAWALASAFGSECHVPMRDQAGVAIVSMECRSQ